MKTTLNEQIRAAAGQNLTLTLPDCYVSPTITGISCLTNDDIIIIYKTCAVFNGSTKSSGNPWGD
ncbi:MAG: hypothetical protein ACR2G0_01595 [Chthoniobacterales bacterium]